MLEIDKAKQVLMLRPSTKDNAAFDNNAAVDTKGYNHLRVILMAGDLAADIGSTTAAGAIKLEESDVANFASGAADISGAELSDPIDDADDNTMYCIDVDLRRSHKRYIRVKAPAAGNGAGTASGLAILGILSRADGSYPNSAAERGFEEHISA